MKLIWNVFTRGMNSHEIEEYNVFNHGRFYEDMKKCLRDCCDKDEFKEELRRDLMYYFGYKVEWEVHVSEPFPHITEEELERLNNETVPYNHMPRIQCSRKIDVCHQIMMNYDRFIDYIWQNRKQVLNP